MDQAIFFVPSQATNDATLRLHIKLDHIYTNRDIDLYIQYESYVSLWYLKYNFENL
jgi:hypothetical protein